jgi:hypothetical protein
MFFCNCLALFVISSFALFAGWNEDFDRQTNLLVQELPALQRSHYLKECEHFKHIRKSLVKNTSLIKTLQKSDPAKKLRIQHKKLGIIIKKRRNNHIHDFFVWELAHLLGSDKYVLPAFPMEIGGVRVVVQKLEPFEVGDIEGGGYSKSTLKKISLETYWKAHIQAYILGLSDLASANIGVNSKGIIRFFDTEASLIYYNTPFKTDFSFSTGFICQSFDWEQYNTPLDRGTAEKLNDFVQTLYDYEDDLRRYEAIRPVRILGEGVERRLEILRDFDFREGVCFRDFFAAVFPRLGIGLPELNQLVNRIIQRDVGHGSTLFFTCRGIKKVALKPHEKKDLDKWITTYIE